MLLVGGEADSGGLVNVVKAVMVAVVGVETVDECGELDAAVVDLSVVVAVVQDEKYMLVTGLE
jgi:hypothetical protein